MRGAFYESEKSENHQIVFENRRRRRFSGTETFSRSRSNSVGSFFVLDEMGPVEYKPGKAIGAPEHPHRGFETVTYLLTGEMEHRDSWGNYGKLKSGDVQWMTAGSGLVHSELPSNDFQKNGGRMHGFQLWVNLPSSQKMSRPRYQDTPSERIPEIETSDGKTKIRVIAGEVFGTKAVIETKIPILYYHFRMIPGADVTVPVPESYNAFVFPFPETGLCIPKRETLP